LANFDYALLARKMRTRILFAEVSSQNPHHSRFHRITMKFFSLTILLAFAARTVRSLDSWAVIEPLGGLTTAPTTYTEMLRNQAPDSELRKGVSNGAAKGTVKGTSKSAAKGAVKGPKQKQSKAKGTNKGMSKGKNGGKGMKKSSKDVKGMGMNKGGKKGKDGGGAIERKCADNQNNLRFVIFPDRENPIAADVDGPAVGFVLLFDGDFIGFQTQSLLILAAGVIAQGQDSFVFFEPEGDEIVGSIAVAFGNNIPVVTGGTGIFLGADGSPEFSRDNELDKFQLLFDICVTSA
jgi:hypothetical protein